MAVAAAMLAAPYETPKKFSGSADNWKFMVTGGTDDEILGLYTSSETSLDLLSMGATGLSEMAFHMMMFLIGFRISIGSILAHKAARALDQRSSAAYIQLFTKLRGPPSER